MDDPAAAARDPPSQPLPVGPAAQYTPTAGGDDFALDAELIKILASDSRRDILRLLHKRRMTLTEMAAALQLKKATVLEHLKKLTDSNLIRRLEDDRLWIYYELSPRGKRVLNPGRTRFYLLLGVTAAALVLGAATFALIYANLHDASPLSANDGLTTSPASAPSSGGISVSLDGASAADARAYLLTPDDVERMKRDGEVRPGIPLALAESEGDVASFRSFSPVPAGTYYLYVVADGRDNLDALPSVRIPWLNVTHADRLWKGFDGDAVFAVDRDGLPANGTLLMVASEGRELPTLPVTNGYAVLDRETLDRLVPAKYTLQYLPPGERFWIALDEYVEVAEPLLVARPLAVPEHSLSTLRLALATFDGAPSGVNWRVEDVPLDESGGVASYASASPGIVELQAGRLLSDMLEVRSDVALRFTATSDGLAVNVSLPDGTTLGGALLQIDGRDVGTTDADGLLAIDAVPSHGVHALTVVADGDPVRIVTRAARFDGWNVSAVEPSLRVRSLVADAQKEGLRVDLTVENAGIVPEAVTAVALLDGKPVSSFLLDVAAQKELKRELRVPLRIAPGDHAVSVDLLPMARSPLTFHNATGGAAYHPPPAASASASDLLGETGNATTSSARYRFNVAQPASGATNVSLSPYAPTPTVEDGKLVSASQKTPAPGLALVAALAVAVALALRRRAR